MKILLGVSGSVAATLTGKLQDQLYGMGYTFKTVVTSSALNFNDDEWSGYLTDENEWHEYKFKRKVLHIDLIKWADAFLIAPCTANTLAKMANGVADNLLTSCALAWDFGKPMYFAPAMNSLMYSHVATQKNINTLKSFGAICIPPQEKKLFCGDIGNGAMADISTICEIFR